MRNTVAVKIEVNPIFGIGQIETISYDINYNRSLSTALINAVYDMPIVRRTSVTGAKVEVATVNPDGTLKKLSTGWTSISGEFTFSQPEGPAKMRITATFKGSTASRDIDVDSAAIYRLALSLDINRQE